PILPADGPALLPVAKAASTPSTAAFVHSKWYRKLWYGQYSLARSFWGFFVLGTFAGVILGMNPVFLFLPAALIYRPVFLVYQIFDGVGLWMCGIGLLAWSGGCYL